MHRSFISTFFLFCCIFSNMAQKQSNSKSTVNQDPVSQQRIWTEHLTKEIKLQKISTQFALNPKSLKYISKKTTQIVPSKDSKKQFANYPLLQTNKNEKDIQSLRNTIQQMELTPVQKFDRPVSTSMDYGWFVNDPKYSIKQAKFADDKDNKKRWHYALSHAPITKFAEHYYLTMGTTLYSKAKAPTNPKAKK